jgi:hypothetical protein
MTLFIPIDTSSQLPPIPSYLVQPLDVNQKLRETVRTIVTAKKMVVISGTLFLEAPTNTTYLEIKQAQGYLYMPEFLTFVLQKACFKHSNNNIPHIP